MGSGPDFLPQSLQWLKMIKPGTILKHGLSKHRIRYVWKAMMSRCYRANDKAYANYGRRGIAVCDRWHDFLYFVQDMGLPRAGMTIERKDNNGNYEPSNCHWASRSIQARNNRRNVLITIEGETLCLTDWAVRIGINRGTVESRISRGWDPARAVLEPCKTQHRRRF